jgi:hypothetical protein
MDAKLDDLIVATAPWEYTEAEHWIYAKDHDTRVARANISENAHVLGPLLAAAPDLLAAVEDLDCPELHSILAAQFGDGRAAHLVNRLRAAIARARGGDGGR